MKANTGKKENKNILMHISHESMRNTLHELKWTKAERIDLENRILSLRNDQIGALCYLVGIRFDKSDLSEVVDEIRTYGHGSGHLSILTDEADSKENILWWIGYFEKFGDKHL